MNKKVEKLVLQYYDLRGSLICEELLPKDQALSKFRMCCLLGVDVHFERANDIRLVSGLHVLYQFRDVRSIVNQRNLFPYD